MTLGTDAPPDRLSADLEATVARCARLVQSVAGRHGLAGADVDEVFQEVRIRLWRALERGERIAGVPASYVYRTAASAALDIIRRRRSRTEEPLEHGGAGERAGPVARSDPESDLAGNETVAVVRRAVEGLIESRRPVVRMHLAGYTLDEIAATLGWSNAKTRNLLYRGMDDLRAVLLELGLRPGGAGEP
jgi:RNA polymerase sigma-70 factor (ECF subfamily)